MLRMEESLVPTACLSSHPRDVYPHHMMASAFETNGTFPQAMAEITKAVEAAMP
jgi:hypothetical protein